MNLLINVLLILGICILFVLEMATSTALYGLIVFAHHPIKSTIATAIILYPS